MRRVRHSAREFRKALVLVIQEDCEDPVVSSKVAYCQGESGPPEFSDELVS